MGFPVVLPHASSDEAAGLFQITCDIHILKNNSILPMFLQVLFPLFIQCLLVFFAVPAKRSSHYLKGVVIGAMSTMGLALVILLGFLWICLLAKKERAAKRYTEVKKQVDPEPSK